MKMALLTHFLINSFRLTLMLRNCNFWLTDKTQAIPSENKYLKFSIAAYSSCCFNPCTIFGTLINSEIGWT